MRLVRFYGSFLFVSVIAFAASSVCAQQSPTDAEQRAAALEAIVKKCGYKESDPPSGKKDDKRACVEDKIRELSNREKREKEEKASDAAKTKSLDDLMTTYKKGTDNPPHPLTTATPPPVRGAAREASIPPPNSASTPDGATHVLQSVWATPNACSMNTNGAGGPNTQGLLSVHRSLLRTQEASDDFGHRLGQRFLVYQVTITNSSKDFEFEVGQIVIDLKPIFDLTHVPNLMGDQGVYDAPNDYARFQASSQNLNMLRGIPEKGQYLDPRNLTLHILQGLGGVAGGVSGLTPFADTMGSAVANFNGAFIQAFTGIAPDHTSTQLNRLSDMAFSSNALIGKLQTKEYAVFVPLYMVLGKDDGKMFKKDPRRLLNRLPLDQLNLCVDGILLTQADATQEPSFSTDERYVPSGTQVAITDGSADIYVTTNGEIPTAIARNKYSAPIAIPDTGILTIKAFAVSAGKAPSSTAVRYYQVADKAKAPSIKCSADNKSAVITAANVDNVLYYTKDGTAPNRGSLSNSTGTATVSTTTPPMTIKALEVGATSAMSDVATVTCGP